MYTVLVHAYPSVVFFPKIVVSALWPTQDAGLDGAVV